MFLDSRLSQLGRSTELQLDGLRRQLGVGIDPAFDYSSMEEVRRRLGQKKEKALPKAAAPEEPEASPEVPPAVSLEELRLKLRETVGGDRSERSALEESSVHAAGLRASPGLSRAQRERDRPSRAFLTTTREDVKKLEQDAPERIRAPPVGFYRVREELFIPRIPGTGPGGDFGRRQATKSRRAGEEEKQGELLERTPEKLRQRVRICDMEKATARPDLVKSAGIVFHENTFTAGVLDGDLACSNLLRSPSWDFAKLSVAPQKVPETFFEPGLCSTFQGAIGEGKRLIPFEKQPSRKPPREVHGRVEIECRLGDHLPDRSLSRSLGMWPARSKAVLSTEAKVATPNFEQYSERPALGGPVPEYHRKDDPEAVKAVLLHSRTFDLTEADRLLRPRMRLPQKFERSLKREQHAKGLRSFAAHNLQRSESSPALLAADAAWRSGGSAHDFGQMPGREPERRFAQPPPRSHEAVLGAPCAG